MALPSHIFLLVLWCLGKRWGIYTKLINQFEMISQVAPWIPLRSVWCQSLPADKIFEFFVLYFPINDVFNFPFFLIIDLNTLGFWLLLFHH